MALALFDRVQETTTTTGTGSVTLGGAVPGFQSFAVVGNGNTCYYTIVDGSAWEVGVGTYSTSGPTLARTTILSNSNGNTSAITLAAGTKSVFLTYPAEKSVNLDASGNVSPLGTVSSGVWQGSTVGVAYGGTGVTSSSGANSVMLRDANQNVNINRLNQSNTNITASAGTTALTAASSYSQTLVGTGNHTISMPDATTLSTGVAFEFNNNATGTLTLTNYASATVGTVASGGAVELVLLANGTVGGTWDVHGYIPENVVWGTNSLYLASDVITGGTWQGGTIQPAYGGTGLTSYTSGGAVYANSSTTLTSGTLPVTAGGTGATTAAGAQSSLNVPSTTGSGASGTWGINITGSAGSAGSVPNAVTFNNGGAGDASGTSFNGAAARTISYNTIGAPSTSGANASGTWGINITGNSASVAGLVPAQFYNNMGNNHTTYTDFNSVPNFGNYFLQGPANGPTGIAGNQFYGFTLGLGNDYPLSLYGSQIYYPRRAQNSDTYIYVRDIEAGTWTSWVKIKAGYADSAGSAGSVDYNALTNKTGGTGTYTTSGDYRAPIFYDSNDTGFYVDPNGTSRLNGVSVYTGALGFVNAARGSTFGYSSSYGTIIYGVTSGSVTPCINVDPVGNASGAFNGNGGEVMFRNGVTFITPTSANTSYHANILQMSDGNVYFGNVAQASGSLRAPIFYDSNNTSYYGDFASTSQFNEATFAGYIGVGGVAPSTNMSGTSGVSIYNANYPSVGFATASGPNYLIYRLGNAGPLTVWNASTSETAYFYTGYTLFTGSARAPIFYDSNDTAYYGDFASSSRLNEINLVSKLTYTGSGGATCIDTSTYDGYVSMRVIRNAGSGNLDGMYIGYANGSSGVTRIFGGGSTGGEMIKYATYTEEPGSFRAPIFYDSNNTAFYVNPNGTSNVSGDFIVNQSSSSGIQLVSTTGTQSLWIRTGWNGAPTPSVLFNNVQFQSSGSSGGSFTFWSGNTLALTITSDYAEGAGSLRAPIFYDSNNTAYYTDPASSSVLNQTTIAYNYGNFEFAASSNSSTSYSEAAIEIRETNRGGSGAWLAPRLAFHWGGVVASQISVESSGRIAILNNPGTGYENLVASITYGSASVRAPIFYDNDNTGYYVDPNGSSYLYQLTLAGGGYFRPNNWIQLDGDYGIYSAVYNSAHFLANIASSYTQWRIIGSRNSYGGIYDTYSAVNGIMYDSGGNGGVYREANGRWYFYYNLSNDCMGIGSSSTNSAYGVYCNKGAYFGSRVDGTIFYDADNTGYYCDPSSTSELNKVYYNSNMVSRNYGIGQVGLYASTRFQAVFSMGESYILPADGTTTGNLYGIAWSYPSAGGAAGNLNTHGALILENGSFLAALSGSIRCRDDMRAPLFYDSNDTGYYVNPNGTSYLNVIGAAGRVYTGYDSGETSSVSCSNWFRSSGNTGWYNASYAGGIYMIDSTWVRTYNDKQFYSSTIILAGASVRAPIFYDSDNTAYYGDFASAGKALLVNGNIECTARSESWAEGIRVNVPSSSTWGGIRFTRGSSTGNWAIGFTGLNATDDLTFYGGTNNLIQLNLDQSGNLIARGNITAYGSPSDRRLKHNIREIPTAIATVLALKPVYYTWNEDSPQHTVGGLTDDLGFIAQDAEEVEPLLVRAGADGLLGLRERGIIALLVKAFQEQDVLIQGLRAEVNALRAH